MQRQLRQVSAMPFLQFWRLQWFWKLQWLLASSRR
jgi:hypothetical protein